MVVMTLMGYFYYSSSIVVYSDELIIFLLYISTHYNHSPLKSYNDPIWSPSYVLITLFSLLWWLLLADWSYVTFDFNIIYREFRI